MKNALVLAACAVLLTAAPAFAHVPPPPANQIIYVTLEKPLGIQMMDTVMVYGKLEIEKSESDIGDAGYRIKADAVEPYAAEETN